MLVVLSTVVAAALSTVPPTMPTRFQVHVSFMDSDGPQLYTWYGGSIGMLARVRVICGGGEGNAVYGGMSWVGTVHHAFVLLLLHTHCRVCELQVPDPLTLHSTTSHDITPPKVL